MADETGSSVSGSELTESTSDECLGETEGPAKKRFKAGERTPGKSDKLEHRLGGILCCAVCLDLPRSAIYQCTNGHLMCAGCFTHLLADARLRDETATCPNCRTVISRELCSRNLAVEKAVCELPTECVFCSSELPRAQIERHEAELCEERGTRKCRLTRCQYSRIGCQWRGPYHELEVHTQVCSHPHKSGGEVMEALDLIDQQMQKEQMLYNTIFELLSVEKITFNDLQFKPYRTDEFIHKLYYETSRFTAFSSQWVVKAHVNDNQRDPTQSCERTLSYHLVLKTRALTPMGIHYMVLKGPFGDLKVNPRLYQHEFTETAMESPYQPLPLPDSAECNKLLAAKAFNFRLIMFHVDK